MLVDLIRVINFLLMCLILLTLTILNLLGLTSVPGMSLVLIPIAGAIIGEIVAVVAAATR